ncbi:ABC transporter permease [Clostridium sardiniense]|uniref:ABC transporter permease n=1 Tax=Clostridium sardiniense TaxID=29369 RepID=UPI001957E3FB|nr:ABC transporter permease [Clostridium sardiniense]MBM7834884.1 ABC-type antimicrobial peptide transport system permease subunit [Clostridium sardiniense]
MKFSSIVRKNFIYNFNKYISFYFVNSMIIAMLFMYGSLLFNDEVVDSIGKTSLYETINMALFGVILFSIVFITYTNMSFLKNRGKEFGMYLTLGMTTKDLTKLIFVENLGIMLASLGTGILSGAILGRLFYMGLNKVLNSVEIPYSLNYKSFLLSVGIFALIFIGNFIFNIFYIKKVSIIDVIKSSKKKEAGKSNMLIGLISLGVLIISCYCLPKVMLGEILGGKSYMIAIFVGLTLICPYMVIGSGIAVVKNILSRFPKLYNNNLLVLSNLSHRFTAYKNILYMVSLLIAGATFFVGYSYSMYTSVREFTDIGNPYDIMFVETAQYNKADKDKVKEVIKDNNGKMEKYDVLEYVEVPRFKEDDGMMTYNSDKESIVSETNYNKHMGTEIDVKPSEATYISSLDEKVVDFSSSILTIMDKDQLQKIQDVSAENGYKLSKDEYKKIAGESKSLYLDGDNISGRSNVQFANFRHGADYAAGNALVLDDKDYELLKNNSNEKSYKKLHLINIKNGDKAFEGLLGYLMNINNLDNSFWADGSLFGKYSYDERGIKESYRPIYKEELISLQLDNSGIIFFTMIFIGLLFVIASGVVLYYKVLSDINEEEERITSLTRIGILQKEVKAIISKELAIVFFVPIIVGGGMGIYYLYLMSYNSGMTDTIMKKSMFILIIGAIIQFIAYLISRKKCIRETIS